MDAFQRGDDMYEENQFIESRCDHVSCSTDNEEKIESVRKRRKGESHAGSKDFEKKA